MSLSLLHELDEVVLYVAAVHAYLKGDETVGVQDARHLLGGRQPTG